MNVPFLDLKAPYAELREELDAAYRRVMESGWYVLGDEVRAFEEEFAAYCGARHCVGVANGLDALHLALRAMGVGEGDEVIVPSNTFIASWLAVTYAGATPVPVEPDERTYNLDPARVEEAITGRTRAVMPVHLYGQPADMDAINEVAARYGLKVIEDAAQAHGARYKGRRAGSLSAAAGFSFYPGKNLGALGDGGAVVTDDDAVADEVRRLRNVGGRVKLRKLDEWNARRAGVARQYLQTLEGVPDLALPRVPEWAEPAWHLFVVRHPRRDELQEHLKSRGVGTLIHYPVPPHAQDAYADLGYARGRFPVAERQAGEILSLPMGPHVSEAEVEHVVAGLSAFARERGGGDEGGGGDGAAAGVDSRGVRGGV